MDLPLTPLSETEKSLLRNPPEFHHLWLLEDKKQHWTLYLSSDQKYLGRAYVWLNRHTDLHAFEDLSMFEMGTLLYLMARYRKALDALWKPVLVNSAWYGNEFAVHRGHGHMHLIPRYAESVTCNGRVYSDENFGAHYKPYEKMSIKDRELRSIRDMLRAALARIP